LRRLPLRLNPVACSLAALSLLAATSCTNSSNSDGVEVDVGIGGGSGVAGWIGYGGYIVTGGYAGMAGYGGYAGMGGHGATGGGGSGGSTAASTEAILFKMESVAGVSFDPPAATVFTLDQVAYITRVMTYHYQSSIGASTQTVSFKNTSTGGVVGPWTYAGYASYPFAAGAPTPDVTYTPGPPDNYWLAFPKATVPAGTYQVIDSSPSTWAYTSDLGNRGVTWVYGMYQSGTAGPTDAGVPATTDASACTNPVVLTGSAGIVYCRD
jgi:hypothetical protein